MHHFESLTSAVCIPDYGTQFKKVHLIPVYLHPKQKQAHCYFLIATFESSVGVRKISLKGLCYHRVFPFSNIGLSRKIGKVIYYSNLHSPEYHFQKAKKIGKLRKKRLNHQLT